MSYDLISGEVIPAVTGGVFSYTRVLTVSDTLLTSPASILAAYIIDGLEDMSDGNSGGTWPLFISAMPDSVNVKEDCGAVYNTTGFKDGRLMEGQVIQHYGVQLKIRSEDHDTGWAKAEAIASSLDAVYNTLITKDEVEFVLKNISRTSPVISLGLEVGTSRKNLFTVNFILTIKRVIS